MQRFSSTYNGSMMESQSGPQSNQFFTHQSSPPSYSNAIVSSSPGLSTSFFYCRPPTRLGVHQWWSSTTGEPRPAFRKSGSLVVMFLEAKLFYEVICPSLTLSLRGVINFHLGILLNNKAFYRKVYTILKICFGKRFLFYTFYR